jgi:hypothetical protein
MAILKSLFLRSKCAVFRGKVSSPRLEPFSVFRSVVPPEVPWSAFS